jgi:hypothetical protein
MSCLKTVDFLRETRSRDDNASYDAAEFFAALSSLAYKDEDEKGAIGDLGWLSNQRKLRPFGQEIGPAF